ncbi:hypothetical protein AGABI1DRAFT_129688 [Agaricus bisporus var. burnettii JB137-S8]|uniref:HNH nuclease domain-containing protein n=1 Tax=Agaricus bisporus var. burnettii (strain JB137-S8 / ATCC MYA-4627 / FGSC 10392) TaxID=597362 RepID=K5XSG9_AGABU|nr:uncharacterized protein AGABI1DRAFT_129688 [Agaricus bisporus var. burnettii JB137-S8]EKM77895.1 hypothetical protein AGABI1DRAFT_129688 [Agaricus bisporus var. burnettii JB137-S8]
MVTPLPKADSDQVQRFACDEPDSLSAYQVCLKFEEQLGTTENVRLVRILGYLLLYAPNRAVRDEVAKCIHSHRQKSDLMELGSFFECNVIAAFKKYKDRTPVSSEHSSRSSSETTDSEITGPPRNHKDAKYQALVRDNWRCVVTDTLQDGVPASVVKAADPPIVVAYTVCAHIIPDATIFNVEPENARYLRFLYRTGALITSVIQLDCSASILAVLKQFHSDIGSFNKEKSHSMANVITMGKNIHDVFERLELYFEATSVKHHYQVKSFSPYPVHPQKRDSVTFSTKNPETLPVPSPELLALHATCCKVAHLSGSAEYIDKVYDDLEEKGVLASDGTSDGFLRLKLLSLARAPRC